jgi:hypothetical protein
MPLTGKGEKILANMKEQYGAEKGERVFYASKNAGEIEGVDSRGDAELKEGDEIKFKNHVIRCSGSPRGKIFTVFGPKQGAGRSYIGEAGTLDGAKKIAESGRSDAEKDPLRYCADSIARLHRRMDSLLVRQRTGHDRSLHDAETKDPSEWFRVNHRYANGTADPEKKFQTLANVRSYIKREVENYGSDPREYVVTHKGTKIKWRNDATYLNGERIDAGADVDRLVTALKTVMWEPREKFEPLIRQVEALGDRDAMKVVRLVLGGSARESGKAAAIKALRNQLYNAEYEEDIRRTMPRP